MDKIVQIGLLGFGTVGTGVVRVLTDNSQLIAQRAGTAITLKKILVRDLNKKRALSTTAELTTDPAAVIGDPEIDIVVELLGGEEPARMGCAGRLREHTAPMCETAPPAGLRSRAGQTAGSWQPVSPLRRSTR